MELGMTIAILMLANEECAPACHMMDVVMLLVSGISCWRVKDVSASMSASTSIATCCSSASPVLVARRMIMVMQSIS